MFGSFDLNGYFNTAFYIKLCPRIIPSIVSFDFHNIAFLTQAFVQLRMVTQTGFICSYYYGLFLLLNIKLNLSQGINGAYKACACDSVKHGANKKIFLLQKVSWTAYLW